VKVAALDPAGTVIFAGTNATAPVVHSSIAKPPTGATALKVTAPVDDVPLATLVGVTATEERLTDVAGVTVSAAVLLTLLYVAVIVTEVLDATDWVVTLKVAVLLPAATVTEAGTLVDALLLDRETEIPPVGAVALKVTVPIEDAPPTTLVGFSETEERVGLADGVTVSAAVLLTLL